MVPVFAVFPQAEGAWWSKIHVCHTWNCIIHIPVKGTILANTILLHPSTVTHSLLWVSAPSRYPHKTVRQQREPDHFFILIKHVSTELSQDTSVFFFFSFYHHNRSFQSRSQTGSFLLRPIVFSIFARLVLSASLWGDVQLIVVQPLWPSLALSRPRLLSSA